MITSLFKTEHLTAYLFILLLCCTGCSSIDTTVSKHLSLGEFEKARLALDKAEAGESVAPDAPPEALLARDHFQAAVESEFAKLSSEALSKGLARRAESLMREATELCPWSLELSQEYAERRELVSALDDFAVRAPQYQGDAIPRHMKVETLSSSDPLVQFIQDSPRTKIAIDGLQKDLLHTIAKDLMTVSTLRDDWCDVLLHDLRVAGMPTNRIKEFESRLEALSALFAEPPEDTIHESLIALLEEAPKQTATHEEALYTSFTSRARIWIEDPSNADVLTKSASFSLIDRLEWLYRDATLNDASRSAIAAVAMSRIDSLSRDGDTAALAWLYLAWARQYLSLPGEDAFQQTIDAAIFSRGQRPLSIAIVLSETIEPLLQRLLLIEFYDLMENEFSGAVEWSWLQREDAEDADIRVAVTNARMFTPDLSALPPVQSRFLSHYEDVPNPAKQFLKGQLTSQEFSVQMAESRYSQSVLSHNAYPTEWSLASVNMARSSYSMAVAAYNSLVNQYNATSSTIRRPVELPYTFYAGTVEIGFSASGDVISPSRVVPTSSAVIDRDFVRRGTKIDDTIAGNRFDDRFDIEASVLAQVDRLSRMVRGWGDEIAFAISELNLPTSVPVKPDEMAVLAWIDHPGGPRSSVAEQRGVPIWAQELAQAFDPRHDLAEPPPINLAKRQVPISSDAVRSEILNATCKIETQSPDGEAVSHGSGVLISSDGLILTCAHILTGSRLEVVILEGPNSGRYSASVLFKNASTDVAVLRAEGLKNESWLEVDFDSADRDTKILVSGYPTAGRGAIAQAALTEGVIVTPIGEEFGQPRLVADVTVASGSSGGPMVDIETGAIVGVVTAIVANEFASDRAATGAFCLAAPASKLREWLGLQRNEIQPAEAPVSTETR